MKRLTAILILTAILLAAAAPCLAADGGGDSSMDTFLSVLDKWGGFLAKLTGAYDVLDYITRFSDIAREWHGFIETGGFSPEGIFNLILNWLGLSDDFDLDGGSSESYSL